MSQSVPRDPPVTFLFDVIITKLQLDGAVIENPKSLMVNAKFNKITIGITQSRINVSEFKSGNKIEFKMEPASLRQSVETNGMPLAVRYKGLTLGAAEIQFPPEYVDRIDAGMGDLLHSDTVNLILRDDVVGSVEILCILNVKCEEPEGDYQPEKQSCVNLGKSINPPDIMFVVGEPQPCPPCPPCLDELLPEEGDEQLKMDLGRYKSHTNNERMVHPPEQVCGASVCSQLRNMTAQYGEIIDSVVRKMIKLPSPMPDEDKVFTDWTGKQKFKPKHVERTIPIPLGDMEEMGIKPIRFCPVCLNPMSWLPKYAPCPCCSTKPQPEIEDDIKPPTASQIIKEILKAPSKKDKDFCEDPCDPKVIEKSKSRGKRVGGGGDDEDDSNDDSERKGRGRCTCTGDKFCAHCRIRNLCTGIFKPKLDNRAECPVVQADSTEDFCVIVSEEEEECRPYLERVFVELRDLYNKRDAKKSEELRKRCAQSLLRDGQNKSGEGPHDLMNKSSAGAILKSVGSPTFLHRIPPPKIGHKTCLKRIDTVSRRHGWAWPSSREARKAGWRPGAIGRCVGAIMRFFLHYSADSNAFNTCRREEEKRKEKERQLPILNVCKKNGSIYITLRAVNNDNIEMKPIVFKIVKSDLANSLRKIKRKLKEVGFRKCTCHQTLMMCVCRRTEEKQQLECALRKECKKRGMENCVDHLILTDTSDSDAEFDISVSPPLAVPKKPLLSIKPRNINMSTQTEKEDQTVEPKYPIKLDPYWRTYDCAAGDRYTGTAMGRPGEQVFEDGIFGFGGGGPHGDSAAVGGKHKIPGIWGATAGGPMRGGGRSAASGGFGGGRGAGPGGRSPDGGLGAGFGGKAFPGDKKKGKAEKSPPIPVKMTQRHYREVAAAEKAVKDAIKNEIERKKKGTDIMEYLMKAGTVKRPWNPNEPQPEPKITSRTGPVLGTDGLTDAQRKRRTLLQMPIPPLDSLARRCKGFDPCSAQCYNSCAGQCYPCCDYC